MFSDFHHSPYLSAYYGPRGFAWLEPGLLAGCAQPGISAGLDSDLEALVRVGIKVVVTLTERPAATAAIEGWGMESIHAPIPDQFPPTVEQAHELCATVADRLKRGEATVFHCRAGKGRTGTLLACMAIWQGMAPEDAISYTRSRNHKWIESEAQLDFLRGYARLSA